MTTLADLIRTDRRRLLEHLAEAGDLDRLMRERGGLPSVPEPVPLCRASRDTTKLVNVSTTTLVTTERTTST